MIVYRLSKSAFCRDLSGKGAELWGGRWNKKGKPLLYTCESRALCITEIAVHTPLGIMPLDYCLTIIEFPDNSSVQEINSNALSSDWRSFPYPESTQKIGDDFIRFRKSLILKVPSAVVPGEFNYLINPGHPDFSKIKIVETEPFLFDDRLFK
jgi:RES domain-containing protein